MNKPLLLFVIKAALSFVVCCSFFVMAPKNRCSCCRAKKEGNLRFHVLDSIEDALSKVNDRIFHENKRKSPENQYPLLQVINSTDRICHKCFSNISYASKKRVYDETPDDSFIRKAVFSHHNCLFSCGGKNDLVCASSKFRFKILKEYKVYSFEGSHVCRSHLQTSNLWPIVKQITTPMSDYKAVTDLFFEFHQKFDKTEEKKTFFDVNNPDNDFIDDRVFFTWIGYSKQQFRNILERAPNCKPVELMCFLCKLRTSLSNSQIGSLFGVTGRTITNYISKVSKDLSEHLVPFFINRNSRSTLEQHNTPICRQLFDVADDKIVIIFDGTYR